MDVLCASHLPVLLERRMTADASCVVTWRARIRIGNTFCRYGCALYLPRAARLYFAFVVSDAAHVPTWNYAAVHVYGKAAIIDDPAALRQIVFDTTAKYESMMPRPWKVPLSDSGGMDVMLKAIVGFSVEVTRVEGKFNWGQNRSAEDQEGMVKGLLGSSQPASQELGRFIMAQSSGASGRTEQNWP